MARKQLAFKTLVQLAVAEAATSPNPGAAGVWAWSTTLGKPVIWDGAKWSSWPASGAGGGGWSIVNQSARVVQPPPNSSPAQVTLNGVQVGNACIILAWANPSYGGAVTGITASDTGGNGPSGSYNVLFQQVTNGGGAVLFAPVTTGGNLTFSVSVTTTSSPTANDAGLAIYVLEVSGLDTSSLLVDSASLPSNFDPRVASLASAPPSAALVLSIYIPDGFQSLNDLAIPSGFSRISRVLSGNGYGDAGLATGLQTCSWPAGYITASGAGAIIAAFRAASGAPAALTAAQLRARASLRV